MQKIMIYFGLLIGGAAFLGMLKLMYDMTGHMARMTDQVAAMSADMGRMQVQMETLVEAVSGIRKSVGEMAPMAEDVHGLRESVGAMAGLARRGSEQIEQINPMQMLQQMVPPSRRR